MGTFVPTTDTERQEMLKEIGISSLDQLFSHIPNEVKLDHDLNIPEGMSELEVRKKVSEIAGKNKVFSSVFRGAGAYRHYIPAIVKNVVSKETFLTAYTPYQAEISQGVLQTIFEYQTMICELTGMDVSNASVYDGATAAAESIPMCQDRRRKKAFVSATTAPNIIETIKTYCFGNGTELEIIPEKDGTTDLESLKAKLDEGSACVIIQHPNYYGNLEAAEEISGIVHEAGAKLVMSVNPISVAVVKTPMEYGADVAVGDGQPLGISLGFGGPYIGFMACTEKMKRQLPGRIVGQTTDTLGRTAYVLTLQAREQHIRREKASSNICSNQALCALTVSVYLSAMGKNGLKDVAIQCMSKAHYMAEQLDKIGYSLENKGEFFHEFVTTSKVPVEEAMKALEQRGILGGYPLSGENSGKILWCCTEMNSKDEIDTVIEVLKELGVC